MPKVQLYFIDKELINPLHNNDFKFETKTIVFVSFLRGRQFYKAPIPCTILNKITNYLNTWETNITTDEIEPCIEVQKHV
jgi:hypothetical protein